MNFHREISDVRSTLLALLLLSGIFAMPCRARERPAVEPTAEFQPDAQTESTQSALRDALTIRGSDQEATAPASVLAYYASRDFTPAWTGSDDAESAASRVLAALARADEQGLHRADYGRTASHWDAPPAPGPEAAEFELSLTADLLRYASDVCMGYLYPRDVYRDVQLPLRRFDIGQALNAALKIHAIDAFLAGLLPPQQEYRGLVDTLARYRTIAELGGWPAVPGKGNVSLESGDARVPALVRRLLLEDPVLAAEPTLSIEAVQQAIQRYQTRNGITPDGSAGPGTLAELNKPVSFRIAQIIANMERWRWMPHTFEKRYISVNVPDQTAQYVRDASVILSSRVIVGRPGSKTPITRLTVSAVVANPVWEVPDDIAVEQILPHLRRSPNYLASRNMVLTNEAGDPVPSQTVDWRKVSATHFPYLIQQNPGSDSAMGVLMMDSPNPFGVYLHDTPGKALFNGALRLNSNGCIRVQQMFTLASLALTDDMYDGADKLTGAILTGLTQRLVLDEPLPVYLLYWTAMAQSDGTVGFRPDLYGRDKLLIAAMSKSRAIAVPRKDSLRQTNG